MYLLLLGNLRLWSVITNESSYGKIRHVEVESLNREIRHSIDLYRLVVIYIFIIADMQYLSSVYLMHMVRIALLV